MCVLKLISIPIFIVFQVKVDVCPNIFQTTSDYCQVDEFHPMCSINSFFRHDDENEDDDDNNVVT